MTTSIKNMNCKDYKEAVAADPSGSFEGGAGHVAGCESCASFKADMQSLDDKIAKALAIDVPRFEIPALPEIDDDNVVHLPPGRRRTFSTPVWFGVAATVILAAFIGVRVVDLDSGNSLSLGDQILAHIDHEPGSLQITNVAIADDRLSRVLNPVVETMDRDVGLITYAQSCVINGKRIPHLVIQGKRGPITLLLMPEEAIERAITIGGASVNGVILPVGNGSIAIIGERGERLDEIEQQLIDSVGWSI